MVHTICSTEERWSSKRFRGLNDAVHSFQSCTPKLGGKDKKVTDRIVSVQIQYRQALN